MSFQSPMRSAVSAAASGLISHPRPSASYSPPVNMPGRGSTSACTPEMSTPLSEEWKKMPLLPAPSALNFAFSSKSR